MPLSFALLFSTACIATASLLFALNTYSSVQETQGKIRETRSAQLNRAVRIISLDTDTKSIRATLLDAPLSASSTDIIFSYVPETLFYTRNPIIENGVLTSLGEKKEITPRDVVLGTNAFVALNVGRDGLLWASGIFVNDPLNTEH